ncbi:hypothetical protein AMS68_002027 [Peltaster fructicola]|uniref:Uncharacterized protein n=1 Tax=Peltaster fructicola TaxID=286661 RepID=A0A6H0XPV4_9PEZI|nr:hypothetical protein AMS68_002027 [Peltaster fructicola]
MQAPVNSASSDENEPQPLDQEESRLQVMYADVASMLQRINMRILVDAELTLQLDLGGCFTRHALFGRIDLLLAQAGRTQCTIAELKYSRGPAELKDVRIRRRHFADGYIGALRKIYHAIDDRHSTILFQLDAVFTTSNDTARVRDHGEDHVRLEVDMDAARQIVEIAPV